MSSLFAQTGGVGVRGIKPGLFISALIVPIILLAIIISTRPVPPSAQITFLGFTNVSFSPQGTLATLCISNTGKCSVYEFGYDYERKHTPRNPSKFQIEFPPQISELKPGNSKIIYVWETPRDEPWRLVVLLAKIDWRYRLDEKWPRFFQKLPWFIRRRLTAPDQAFCSDWINPEMKPNVIGTSQSTSP